MIGTIPGALAGALFEDVIEEKLGKPWLIAVMLAVFGIVLYVVDRRARRTRDVADITLLDAVVIGVAQAVALQPGSLRLFPGERLLSQQPGVRSPAAGR